MINCDKDSFQVITNNLARCYHPSLALTCKTINIQVKSKFSYDTVKDLCRKGDLGILIFLKVELNWKPDDEALMISAQGGHLHLIEWLIHNGCSLNEWICNGAAQRGHLDLLEWAHNNGCRWTEMTCRFAGAGGHMKVFEWARQKGCPWALEICYFVARGGKLIYLKWMCPVDPLVIEHYSF